MDTEKLFQQKYSMVNGTKGIYDLADIPGKGVFKIWDAGNNFFKVHINKVSGAISWPGEIDIDTLNAYCSIQSISPDNFTKKISSLKQNWLNFS